MKNIIRKSFTILLAFSIVLPVFTVKISALNTVDSRDKLRRAVYIGNDSGDLAVAFGQGLSVKDGSKCDFKGISRADVIVVDYDAIIERESNNDAVKELKNYIYSGAHVYIRANDYDVDRNNIISMFGFNDCLGEVSKENKDDGTLERVCGFFVYIDSQNRPQVTQSVNVLIPSEQNIDGNVIKINNIELDVLHESDTFDYGLNKELDDVDNYLDFLYEQKVASEVRNITETINMFEEAYSTEKHYTLVRKANGDYANQLVGNINVNLYARRLWCANSDWYDDTKVTSKWYYASKIFIQPKWYENDSYRSVNKKIGAYFVTHPQESSSETYAMMLIDYAPENASSNGVNATVSVGLGVVATWPPAFSGNTEFSLSTSYKDIVTYNQLFERGRDTTNVIGNHFLIGDQVDGTGYKLVNTTTVSVYSAAIMWNYYTRYSRMQIGYTAFWRVLQGEGGSQGNNNIDFYESNTYLWQPAELW